MAYYDEFENQYYNPDDNDKKPGLNENWKMIQKGFSRISKMQLETSEGLTLGKGTEDEESLTADDIKEIRNAIETLATEIGAMGNNIANLSTKNFVYTANNSNTLTIPSGDIVETEKVDLSDLIIEYNLSGGHYKVIPFSLMGHNLIVMSARICVVVDEFGEIGQTNALPNYESASDCYAYVKLYNPTNASITIPSQYFGFYITRSEQY